MANIKKRRLNELALSSYPDVRVGDCVPFYFCPRSVMLYILWRANHPDLLYRGGQAPIIHLEADLYATVEAANRNEKRWAFTTSNAGSRYFEDYSSLNDLDKVNWNAIRATDWKDYQEEKQAEFLVEGDFPWFLVERIGVCSEAIFKQVDEILKGCGHEPHIETRPDWYY